MTKVNFVPCSQTSDCPTVLIRCGVFVTGHDMHHLHLLNPTWSIPGSKLRVSKTEPGNHGAFSQQSPLLHGTCDYLHLSTFKSFIDTWPRSRSQSKSDGRINFYSTHWMFDWSFDARLLGSSHPVLIRSFCVVIQRINRKPPRNWCLLCDSKNRSWFFCCRYFPMPLFDLRDFLWVGVPLSAKISSRSSEFSDRW